MTSTDQKLSGTWGGPINDLADDVQLAHSGERLSLASLVPQDLQ
jgi:hypothetical protein